MSEHLYRDALEKTRQQVEGLIDPDTLLVDKDRHRPGWVVGIVPPANHPDLERGPDVVYTTDDGRVYIALALCPTLDDLLSTLAGIQCLGRVLATGLY